MGKVQISKGKFAGLNACADQRGVIAALAVDHRGNLLEAIARARGPQGQANADDMLAFKTAVTRMLTPHVSAVLLDPEYGLEAIPSRAPGRGVLLAYEQSGYDTTIQGRQPDLLPEWSVRRLVEAGAQAIKILMYYNAFDTARVNAIKQAYVERIGAECAALDVPFFLEPLAYDDALGDDKGLAFARKKPEYVTRAMEEFSRPRYGVDVLKVEIPVNPAYVSGLSGFGGGEYAFTRQEAMAWFRAAASATSKPFIFLSAGVTNVVFCELLELAAEAGVRCSGVLCGRATWQDGIAIYAREGLAALERWLEHEGVQHVRALNAVLEQSAIPWWNTYGGRGNIEAV
jgi:tagatose 1,6-diphosphate aldolase